MTILLPLLVCNCREMEQEVVFRKRLKRLNRELMILPDKQEETPQNTLYALWFAAAGQPISPVMAENNELPELTADQVEALDELIDKRLAHVPLAHLTERQNFMGMDFIVSKGLYIPRKETELLATTCVSLLTNNYEASEAVRVIDLCTGVGTLALTIGNYCKNAYVYGSDINPKAIELANMNAKQFELTNQSAFFCGDFLQPFDISTLKGDTQLIVCAPPYISTNKVRQLPHEISENEPFEAFDGGPFALSFFMRIISKTPEYLESGGFLVFECGQKQGEYLIKKVASYGLFTNVIGIKDEQQEIRVIQAQKV